MDERTTQERWEKLILHRDLIIQEANLKGADIPLNSSFPEIIAGIARITIGLDAVAVETLLDSILGEVVTGDYTVKGQAIEDAKEAIRQAIIAKEVEVPAETPLSQFPAKIAAIEGGGGGTGGTIPVYFVDTATGKVISEQLVVKGEDAILPANPTHEHLTFTGWKGNYHSVTEERWVAAMYDTNENATFINVRINLTSLLSVVMNIWKSDTTEPIIIDWGDSVVDNITGNGNLSPTHTYSTPGCYCIKITSTEQYALGHSSSSKSLFDSPTGVFNYIVESIYFPAQAKLNKYAVNGCRILKGLILSNGITTIPGFFIYDCNAFEFYAIPDSVIGLVGTAYNTSIIAYFPPANTQRLYGILAGNTLRYILFPSALRGTEDFFRGSRQVRRVILPLGVESVSGSAFKEAYSIELIDMPSSVTGLYASDIFNSCSSLRAIIFRYNGVIAANATAFREMPQTTYIYVPDDLVDDYKAYPYGAWPTVAEQVKPLSQLPAEFV